MNASLAHAVLLVSGAAGLGCQLVWTRMFGLGLGQELPATFAVVGAVFAGLALGAWRSDGWVRRTGSRPLRLYAALEGLIGLWVLGSIALVPAANRLALDWIGLEPSVWRHALVAFGLPLVALLPATAAMGATLAAMESFARDLSCDGRVVGSLYAANTLGAVLGVLGAVELSPRLGQAQTLGWLGAMNLACAVAVLVLARRGAFPEEARHSPLVRITACPQVRGSRLRVALMASGLLGIGLEVLGIRVLRLGLEDTARTWASLLAVYLLATALGAAGIPRLAVRWPGLGTPALGFAAVAVSSIASGWVLGWTPWLYPALRDGLGGLGEGVLLAEALVAAAVFGGPCFFMGGTFASLAQAAREGGFGLGRALAWNTLGGAVAPVAVGVLAFPWLGAKGTLAMLVLGYAVLAFGFARDRRRAWILTPLALAWLAIPDLRLASLRPGETLRTLREGVSDSVAVVGTPDGHRTLRVNQRFTMGGTASAAAERRQAHIPLLLHPRPRRVLFLGSATGITAAAATAHPGVEVDSVELVPEVVAVMPEFAPENATPPGRLRQYTADARRFVRATPYRYDVIVADLFHPGRDGAGALYTREHFAAIRDRLEPGGLFCQWVPLYQVDAAGLGVIAASVRAAFPVVRGFLLRPTIDTPALGLVGTGEATRYPGDWFDRRVREPGLREALKAVGLTDTVQLLGGFLLDGASVSLRPDTDDRQTVGARAAEWNRSPAWRPDATLFALLAGPRPAFGSLLEESAATPGWGGRLAAYGAARDAYLQGLRLEADRQPAAARAAFVDSARLSPDFTTGYAQVVTMAVQISREDPGEARRMLEALIEARPESPVARALRERLFPGSTGGP